MGEVTQNLYQIYVTEETNCAEALFKAGVQSRGREAEDSCCQILGVYSGGVSSEAFCGAILGGAAAIGYLMNHRDEESFETSKAACHEFVERCQSRLKTTACNEIMLKWRNEDTRCYSAVEQIAEELEIVLKKYSQ